MKGRFSIAVIASIIISIASGYVIGRPLATFILVSLASLIAGYPRRSVLAASIGVITWYTAGIMATSKIGGLELLEITSQIAGIPITVFYIMPLLIGLLVSTMLAYGLSYMIFKR